MMKCLNCLLLILGVIIQESDSILIERENFDSVCNNINQLISQGVSPIEATEMATKELQLKKNKNLDESIGSSFTRPAYQVVQTAGGRINWLFTLFNSIIHAEAEVNVQGTNSTKVGFFGKGEASSILKIPCELIPFPSVVNPADR